MKLIDGRKLAQEVNMETKKMVESLKGRVPGLAIILVGQREDSKLYVKLKEKEARSVGIETHTYLCGEEISQDELLRTVDYLNGDAEVDAILVQLPLPEKFDTEKIISMIDPGKDADGFHPENIKSLQGASKKGHPMPPVLATVLRMLESVDCNVAEKKICVVANSEIFGKSLAKVLEYKGADVCVLGASEKKLAEKMKEADVVISAVGKAHFIKAPMLKQNAIVIDIGITKKGKRVLGDVDLESVKDKVSFITPVPGGVGPMTVAMLLCNTAILAKKNF